MIVTTNHVDKVDPALRNRKGRIDRVVHFDALDHAGRVTLARRITGDPGLAERLAAEHHGAQTSTFVEACCTAARRARYESQVNLGPLRTAP